MPRSVRIEYPGAVYHVLCRGDRRENIFAGESDRVLFLSTLGEMCGRTGIVVHSYVLMSNHYHLLLETPEPNLVAGMQWFQGTYTQRFNARHRLSGHLFQGRYKAIPVEADRPEYFRLASQYIHLNPARAGLLEGGRPELTGYKWSSFPRFVEKDSLPGWLQRRRVFSTLELPDEGAGSRRRYRKWMDRKVAESLESDVTTAKNATWAELQRGWYLGSDSFRDRLMDRASAALSGRKRASFAGDGLRAHDDRSAERLLAAALAEMGNTPDEMRRLKKNDPRKQALAWIIKSRTVVSDEWVMRHLGMGHRSNVSRAVSAFRSGSDRELTELRKLLHICTD